MSFKCKKKNKWELDDNEKLLEAQSLKNSGNDAVKMQDYSDAFKLYKEAISYVDDKESKPFTDLHLQLLLNISLAGLKINEYLDVVNYSTEALKISKNNIKALFRRASASYALNNFEEARTDIKLLLETDPNNSEAINLQNLIIKKIQTDKQKEKQLFGKLFQQAYYEDPKKVEPEVGHP